MGGEQSIGGARIAPGGTYVVDLTHSVPTHLTPQPPITALDVELTTRNKDAIFPPLHWLFLVMRFFNLLEPGRYVISISKLWMWVMLGVVIYVFAKPSGDQGKGFEVVAAAAGLVSTMGNYAWRRYIHHHDKVKLDFPPKDEGKGKK